MIDKADSARRGRFLRVGLLTMLLIIVALLEAGSVSAVHRAPPSARAMQTGAQAGVPAEYQPLYDTLQRAVADDDQRITGGWDSSLYPVGYSAELLSADGNGGMALVRNHGALVPGVDLELDALQSLGVTAVVVQSGFPLLDQQFFSFNGTPDLYDQFLSFYSAVAQDVHQRGMRLIIEANPLLTFATGSTTSLDARLYYQSLDLATYTQRRSNQNILIAQQLQPDYLILQSEPQTDAINVQNPAIGRVLNDPAADTALVQTFVDALDGAGIAGLHGAIQLGSGVGTWQSDWQAYVTGLLAIPDLDKIDSHVYNLQPDLDELDVAVQIADQAHAAGKGASIAEFWLHKSTSLAGFSPNGDPLLDVRARDTFSFWAPLDQQFMFTMAKLANAKQLDYISAFGIGELYAYLNYDGTAPAIPCTPAYPPGGNTNAVCDVQISQAELQAASRALATRQLSGAGSAYAAAIAAYSPH